MQQQVTDRKLNVSQVIRLTGLTRKVLQSIPHELPFFELKAGSKTIRRYRESDVNTFLERNTRNSTA